jgi:DNA-binding NarL/FixJ family response regulator
MTGPLKILIVEDQYLVAVDAEVQLRAAGFQCVGCATTAEQAVELTQAMAPDLVLMDVRLAGESDGVRAAIAIYQRFGIQSVFVSGHADARVREDAEPAHPLGWVTKPYGGDELVRSITKAAASLRPSRSRASSTGTERGGLLQPSR